MDVLAAILMCSLHDDQPIVRAIVDNAQANPFAVLTPDRDASTPSPPASTYEAAVAQLRDATAHGLRPLLGLMQVPPDWADMFGRAPEDLFDPCVNVSIGTAMLSAFDYECRRAKTRSPPTAPSPTRRTCVARRYAVAVRMPDLEAVVALELRSHAVDPVEPADAPIFRPLGFDQTWGANCLLVGPLATPKEAEAKLPAPKAGP
jgi:hypothetical protein